LRVVYARRKSLPVKGLGFCAKAERRIAAVEPLAQGWTFWHVERKGHLRRNNAGLPTAPSTNLHA
jgi:hypothetical protein